jgi:hypothetical protein
VKGTDIPVKGTDIPVNGTDIPVNGTDIPVKGTEFLAKGTDYLGKGTGIAFLYYCPSRSCAPAVSAQHALTSLVPQGEPSPGADVGGASPVPAQMWVG